MSFELIALRAQFGRIQLGRANHTGAADTWPDVHKRHARCMKWSVYLQIDGDSKVEVLRCDGHIPSIYLSILSHCVLPVDSR